MLFVYIILLAISIEINELYTFNGSSVALIFLEKPSSSQCENGTQQCWKSKSKEIETYPRLDMVELHQAAEASLLNVFPAQHKRF